MINTCVKDLSIWCLTDCIDPDTGLPPRPFRVNLPFDTARYFKEPAGSVKAYFLRKRNYMRLLHELDEKYPQLFGGNGQPETAWNLIVYEINIPLADISSDKDLLKMVETATKMRSTKNVRAPQRFLEERHSSPDAITVFLSKSWHERIKEPFSPVVAGQMRRRLLPRIVRVQQR
ncbi:hypothetical protein BJ508DRAFT_325639 [Ascobolus immersus RN42]|uniref:Uncharacterized protein n=1 Tax=Ascobolus immersus RN42 TaxID=1160509 RepID=A0A3N4I8G0_ASCIM|nr:hypothetical protein BJ508DRAFT_325639 [Ascobolus immersus RN42]